MNPNHAEVIFETGSKSVAHFEDLDELKGFLIEHNRRAVEGENGGPSGHPAERIKRVLLYEAHPADYAGPAVVGDNVRNLVDGMAGDGDVIDGNQLIAAVRDEMSPTFPQDQGRHESMYKMDGEEMDLSFLGGDDNAA